MTPRERKLLVAIADHLQAFGWPPSIGELCAALGYASRSTVHARLGSLERRGLIVRGSGPRELRLTGDLDVAVLVSRAMVGWNP